MFLNQFQMVVVKLYVKIFFKKKLFFKKLQILSTNIAEASLTINDVVFVIDCGKVKQKFYDLKTHTNELKLSWIAKSNAEQRCGRAGRCCNGFCFRLYSSQDFDKMLDTQIPEIQRLSIYVKFLRLNKFKIFYKKFKFRIFVCMQRCFHLIICQ